MRHRMRAAALAAVSGICLSITNTGWAAGADTPPAAVSPTVSWQSCPSYSDEVLEYLRIRPEDRTTFRDLWARTECGTVRVPLDYRKPQGEQITVALTRLKAKDRTHRLGSLSMNPGGPGGSGYLMPTMLVLQSPTVAQLNDRYDLIGFDPRGVGYSTSFDCPRTGPGGPMMPETQQLTKEQLKTMYDDQAKENAACSSANPRFLAQLTTANAARDLDGIRRALHEKTMNFFGASWGTQLGAVYRSMFPKTIGRMWLDSVVSPRAYDLAYRFDYSARTTEQLFALYADWLAARDSTYGLGDSAAEVRATVLAMRQAADAHPWQFSDLPLPLGGGFIAFLASATNFDWSRAAEILHALTTATNGGPAPQVVKDVIGIPDGPPPEPPAGTPAGFNDTAGHAYLCNEDTSAREFEPLWQEYQRNLRRNPITGEITALRPTCAGWTLPVQRFQLRRSTGSLQMSGHKYETSTPYRWARQMQDAIGGNVLTVEDFAHGSLPFVPECAAHLVAYFDTGNPDNGTCQGMQPRDEASGNRTASSAARPTTSVTTSSGIRLEL
ncbi:alpha/beta fold hydrolase [Streptomyces sp. H39-S7]|uniref:alpha/beta fold hydrolase n=1 Tax=Streptomyces sp. H39-S7 TaxID=3004357 RepID=UPI0022B018B0|nr:alpha/beta fold hydrolase [Streptomyces sp. H39-S7]MCZ4126127.1 alpha/beta fold hydrolase [Streptomyces sp. H39-S7]